MKIEKSYSQPVWGKTLLISKPDFEFRAKNTEESLRAHIALVVMRFLDATYGRFLRWSAFLVAQGNSEAVKSTGTSYATPAIFDIMMESAARESAEFAKEEMSDAMMFATRHELWEYCILKMSDHPSLNSIVCEFGVWKGESLNYFAQRLPDKQLFGFDSFLGLPEDWSGYKYPVGAFDNNGQLPEVLPNVVLHKGLFENTVPDFVAQHQGDSIRLLHLDADTYSSSVIVLDSLRELLSPGTIIVFDEFFGYPNWRLHEFRAWTEFRAKYALPFKYIAFSNSQVAVRLS